VLKASRELKADHHRASLILFLSQVLKIVVISLREWQHFEQELHVHQKLLIIDPWSHEFTRMNLSASPLPSAPLSMVYRQIFGVGSEGTTVHKINLR
jgi:hypothetical protein